MIEDKDYRSVKNILAKGTSYKAPSNLSDKVLLTWRTQQMNTLVFRPIIPSWFWWLLGIFVSGVFIFAASSNSGNSRWSGALSSFMEYLAQSFYQIELIVFSSMLVLVILILLNTVLINTRYKKLSY